MEDSPETVPLPPPSSGLSGASPADGAYFIKGPAGLPGFRDSNRMALMALPHYNHQRSGSMMSSQQVRLLPCGEGTMRAPATSRQHLMPQQDSGTIQSQLQLTGVATDVAHCGAANGGQPSVQAAKLARQ